MSFKIHVVKPLCSVSKLLSTESSWANCELCSHRSDRRRGRVRCVLGLSENINNVRNIRRWKDNEHFLLFFSRMQTMNSRNTTAMHTDRQTDRQNVQFKKHQSPNILWLFKTILKWAYISSQANRLFITNDNENNQRTCQDYLRAKYNPYTEHVCEKFHCSKLYKIFKNANHRYKQ